MERTLHEVRIGEMSFKAIETGEKTFDIRENGRGFQKKKEKMNKEKE